jgi:cyclopropane fatty-acyl-phospholipid synthase-like methyltransferase
MSGRKSHWENVFRSKSPEEVSWTQEVPETSLLFIRKLKLPKTAGIIDVGGGDSKLVDHLLDEGFINISVLDISTKALEKAKQRLGERAIHVKWIVSDILEFNPSIKYDLWHDRAAFHFLTEPKEIRKYIQIAEQSVKGFLSLATFSDKGPKECSGLPVRQYSEELIQKELSNGFHKIECKTEDHITPFGSRQNFLICSFKKIQSGPTL